MLNPNTDTSANLMYFILISKHVLYKQVKWIWNKILLYYIFFTIRIFAIRNGAKFLYQILHRQKSTQSYRKQCDSKSVQEPDRLCSESLSNPNTTYTTPPTLPVSLPSNYCSSLAGISHQRHQYLLNIQTVCTGSISRYHA